MLIRVFGVLGPTEAAVEMLGFTAVLWAAGWRPGGALPGADVLLAASGTAFAAVVLGQAANAFACRSTTDWPGTLGWTTNRLLLIGVAVELLLLLLFLYTPPLAAFLNQAPPTALGLARRRVGRAGGPARRHRAQTSVRPRGRAGGERAGVGLTAGGSASRVRAIISGVKNDSTSVTELKRARVAWGNLKGGGEAVQRKDVSQVRVMPV